MSDHEVIFMPSGIKGKIKDGVNLLDAARELGVGVESICGGTGACCKCKVQILEGTYDSNGLDISMAMISSSASKGVHSGKKHVSDISDHEQALIKKHNFKTGQRLGCQAKVHGDVVVFVPEESRVRDAVVRKAAGKPIETRDPVARKFLVHVDAPSLEDPRGDWERVQDALQEQHDIKSGIDFFALKQLAMIAKPQRTKAMVLTVTVWNGCEVVRVENGDTTTSLLGLAVDLGTTTM
ncbi:MAG: 2Fe-2S iron-sulfur cluster binding domain-containing protein, partial [Halioglobus sp.]|nr:2Fe-2S iron-sulfur cluster binding domain-containing protein [Halioglobus sp.]